MRSLTSRVFLGSLLAVFAPLAVVGCSGPRAEDAESSDSDLSTSGVGTACSAPVRSDDGKYVLLDLCPADGAPGKIVRLDIGSGEKNEVTTYPATDRIETLSSVGSRFFFGVRHAVDRGGRATAGIDVNVHDWSLTTSRTIATAPPSDVDGTFRALETLMLSDDGAFVAYSAADGALANYLFVAPVEGDAAPVGLDLGIASRELRWSASGASFVGHQPDDTSGTGETLVLVDAGGESGALLVAKRHTSLTSFEFGQGGVRRQRPFDGTRVVGFKTVDGQTSVGTVDPRTGEETLLDTAPVLSIVSDLGSDILYARVTEVPEGGGFKRDLVKLPRAGGTPTILLSETAPTRDEVAYGFEPLALSPAGAFGYFATRQGSPSETATLLIKLDGSSADRLTGKVHFVGLVGDKALIENQPQAEGAVASFDVLDLVSGGRANIGTSNGTSAYLVGDGTAIQFSECRTEQGAPGLMVTQPSTGEPGGVSLPCARMPWVASEPLAAANSSSLVFYNSYGTFPNYRYDVGIIKP